MNKKNTNFVTVAALILISVSVIAYVFTTYTAVRNGDPVPSNTSTTTAFLCDTDERICADGTILKRNGTSCEFTTCPVSSPTIKNISPKNATLYGSVTLSPTCPVERVDNMPQCAPKPYVTEVTAFDESSFELVASTKTTNSGTFILNLLPGNYTIRARDGAVFPRCEEKILRLLENSTSSITLSCDSGIR